MKSAVPLLDRIMHYIGKRKGNKLRPMFVFFSAGMCGGITESTMTEHRLSSCFIQQTLVHDDVVDDSTLRRGFFLSMPYGKIKIAVL
jgi:octaprenyl-diphosphate synthase